MRSSNMLNQLLKDTKFKSEVNNFYRQHKEQVLDIILFGSAVKGKITPSDIDILLIFKEKESIDTEYELKNNLKAYKVSITSKTYHSLFSEDFKARESILTEGFSLINKKPLSSLFGFSQMTIFKYSLKGKNESERMRFYFSLYGRGKDEGILKEYDMLKFSGSTILCPTSFLESAKDYLNSWNINFNEYPILIPTRVINALTRNV